MTSTAIVLYQAAPVAVIASPVKKPKAEVDIFAAWLKANKFATEERKVIKVIEGLSGSKNIWKEPPQSKPGRVERMELPVTGVTEGWIVFKGCDSFPGENAPGLAHATGRGETHGSLRAVRTSTFRAYSRPPWSRVQRFMVAKQPASQLVVCRAGGEPLALLDGQKGAAG